MYYKNFNDYTNSIWGSHGGFNINLKSENEYNSYIVNELLQKYNEKELENFITRTNNGYFVKTGIEPLKFNAHFDLFKVLMSSIVFLQENNIELSYTMNSLKNELLKAYPYYIPLQYNLPFDYNSVSGNLNTPGDVCLFIIDNIALENIEDEISFMNID